jgi:ppGpp synthetase/RelA/SpoT-type nucleotidyltranferase
MSTSSTPKAWARTGSGSRAGGPRGGSPAAVKDWAAEKPKSGSASASSTIKRWGTRANAAPGKLSEDERKRVKETVDGLKRSIEAGRLKPGVTLGRHVAIAKDMQQKHAAEFDKTKDELKKMAPADASVKGRVKETESILGKLERKPKYGTAEKLQDTTGLRVVTKDLEGVRSTVAKLKERFKVVEEDNYIDKPQGETYRSHHLVVETPSGLQKEIQVRTEAQNRHAEWAHGVYKPKTEAQKDFLRKNADAIQAYSKAVSDHFHAQATGRSGTRMPTPPPGMHEHFGAVADEKS